MRVLTAEQMREADRRTIDDHGIASLVLMENAGRQVVAAIDAAFEGTDGLTYAVLCGKGHNGGDGFVAARVLRERGARVRVFLVGREAEVRGDARVNLRALASLDVDVIELGDAGAWELHAPAVLGSDLIIDAIVGTGLTAPVTGLLETIVEDVNASDTPVVAVDVPTGVDASVGELPGPAIDASLTVTFGAPKRAHVLPPAERQIGSLVVANIGIPDVVLHGVGGPWLEVITRESVRGHVTPRPADSQKGDYGRILIVAGSMGKTGAAWLAAMGALRSGAGLVTVATPKSCQPILASLGVEYMTLGLDETEAGAIAYEAADAVVAADVDVLVIGPGLGRHPGTTAFVHAVVERAGVPVVLDADGLYAFTGDVDRLQGRDDAPIIVTPHPGEMARLLDTSIEHVQDARLDLARDLAVTRRLHVVLKGHRTVVATPEGRLSLNTTGNPGMATGGTGDVLAGMVGAWCGQLLDVGAACQLAVYLHGAAGDLAAADEGEVAMVAGDLLDRLGDAVLELTARRRPTAERPRE